jgi:CubicO group peptidase (beta-lactamase class C family)
MRPIQKTQLIAALALALSLPVVAGDLPTASPQSQGLSPTRLARLRDVIQTEINADRMPGAVVLVARKGAIVHSEVVGFQDKGAGKPLKRDAIFRA